MFESVESLCAETSEELIMNYKQVNFLRHPLNKFTYEFILNN